MSFQSQLIGFLKRNLKLKLRNKFQIFPELYNPFSILLVLILFNFIFKSENYGPEQYEPENFESFSIYTMRLYFYPDTNLTRTIANSMRLEKFNVKRKFFSEISKMKSEYLTDSFNRSVFDIFYGIEFSPENLPYEYKIYNAYDEKFFKGNKVILTANGKECRKNGSFLLTAFYKECAGNTMRYNGFAELQFNLDRAIKKVCFFYSSFKWC